MLTNEERKMHEESGKAWEDRELTRMFSVTGNVKGEAKLPEVWVAVALAVVMLIVHLVTT